MRYWLLILIIISGTPTYAQPHKMAKEMATMAMDSAILSVYQVATREMILSEDQITERLLGQMKLQNEKATSFSRIASKKSSYRNERALLTHYNMVVEYYRNGKTYGNFTISTKTGNITIYDLLNENEAFAAVSKSMGDHIIGILKRSNMLELINPLDLEGLNPR